jgi:parvulin-like peptidyl-prolyl isomerase
MPLRPNLLVLVLALACHGRPKPPSEVLAQVGEVTITRADFDGFLEYQTKGQVSVKDASLELKQMVLRKLVVLELLVREAHRVKLETRHEAPAKANASVYAAKEWLANGLLQETPFPPVPESTEEERRAYFDGHPEEFTIPERIRASVVIVGDQATAARLRGDKRLLQDPGSEDFIGLVNEFCTDPLIRSHGGDLGWVLKKNNHGWEPQELIEAAGRLKNIGDISAPIKLEHGWAIFRLTDHRAAESLVYENVKDGIDSSARGVKFGQQTEDFIAHLRSKATVSVHEDRLAD